MIKLNHIRSFLSFVFSFTLTLLSTFIEPLSFAVYFTHSRFKACKSFQRSLVSKTRDEFFVKAENEAGGKCCPWQTLQAKQSSSKQQTNGTTIF